MSQDQSAFLATDSAAGAMAQLADDPRLTQALEEYLAALEVGQLPDRDQLLENYPDLADMLGDYLDGLEFLHGTAVHLHADSGDVPAGIGSAPVCLAPPLEDYEILGEVGRG